MKRLMMIISVVMMLAALTVTVNATEKKEEKKIIRVGAFNLKHMQEKSEDGEYTGYSFEYLKALLPYTNWEYEFVEGSFAECIEWIKTGEIDIIGCMIKTPEREEIVDFVEYYSGYNGTKLLVKNDNMKYALNDYEVFDGIVIGIQKSTAHLYQIEQLAKEKGFSYKVAYYDTEKQILEALENEDIDAACLFGLKVEDWTRVISVFNVQPYFYAVTKGNTELLKELNTAIGKKKSDDPMFEENLRREFHVNESKNTVVFSHDEKRYLSSVDVIRVGYDSNFMPIEGKDAKTNQPSGYTIEVLRRISEITGLEFEYITSNEYMQSFELLSEKKIDVLSSFTTSVADVSSERVSNAYLNLNVVLIGRTDFYFDSHDEIIIATPLRAIEFLEGIKKIYPNCKFQFLESGEDAYQALVNKKADLAIRNIYSAQVDIATKYNEFRVIYDLGQMTQVKFLFSEDVPKELQSIFNKCIASFDESESNEMMMRATIERIDMESQALRILIISLIAVVLAFFTVWLCLHLYKARRRLLYAAFNDELTALPNLAKFKIKAKKILQENPNRAYAILLTDIADFSFINEKYGFEIGDLVIKSVANTLVEIKSPTTLTARIFSNMFINLYEYDEMEEYNLTENPRLHVYEQDEMQISFFHYFGKYLIPLGESDVDSIYEKVSYAHLFAKKNGIKERIVDYDEEAKKVSIRNKEIEAKMMDAIKLKDFKVFLQAKYKCDGRTLVGAEALVRWFDSTTNQMIFPNEFIPLFERNGFVTTLDIYMFEEVCSFLANWKRNGFDLITISVNFSRLHFSNPNMAEELLKITQKYGVDTKYLEIEITENALSTKVNEITETIEKLSKCGFKISLDDFSSQHSSLLFLTEVPVNVVKLDKAFVSSIVDSNVSRLLVDGTIQILKKLDFEVVAEGVEVEEQVELLDEMKCDIIQGYVFAKPVPANDVIDLLSSYEE